MASAGTPYRLVLAYFYPWSLPTGGTLALGSTSVATVATPVAKAVEGRHWRGQRPSRS